MIIGKDNLNKSFTKNYNPTNTQNNSNFTEINTMKNANILDKDEMRDKSFDMLQDRLNKGLISLDEFNRKCKQLNKK